MPLFDCALEHPPSLTLALEVSDSIRFLLLRLSESHISDFCLTDTVSSPQRCLTHHHLHLYHSTLHLCVTSPLFYQSSYKSWRFCLPIREGSPSGNESCPHQNRRGLSSIGVFIWAAKAVVCKPDTGLERSHPLLGAFVWVHLTPDPPGKLLLGLHSHVLCFPKCLPQLDL